MAGAVLWEGLPEVVLMEIFQHLPTSSLLSCSQANLWRQKAGSFIQTHRECTAKVGYDGNLWENLLELDEALGIMNVIPNSLRILVTSENVNCDENADINALTNLLNPKLFTIKFLSVYEQREKKRRCCSGSAASTVLELIRRNSSTLQELEIRCGVRDIGLFKGWQPQPTEMLENLKKLSINYYSSVSVECMKKIIDGAPHLRAIHNDCLHMFRHNLISQNKHWTLKRLTFGLDDIELVQTFANRLNQLEELMVTQNHNDEIQELLPLCQRVFSSNAATLCSLAIRCEDNSVLSHLKIPELPSIKNLYISVMDITASVAEIMSINFPHSLPNLRHVSFRSDCVSFDYDHYVIPAQKDIVDYPNASQAEELELCLYGSVSKEGFVNLRRLFPKVSTLLISDTTSAPFNVIANLWLCLKSLRTELRSFDIQELIAQVFGLDSNILNFFGLDFLDSKELLPRGPCMATMKELRYLQIDYPSNADNLHVRMFLRLAETVFTHRSDLKINLQPSTRFKNFIWSTPRFGDFCQDGSPFGVAQGQFR